VPKKKQAPHIFTYFTLETSENMQQRRSCTGCHKQKPHKELGTETPASNNDHSPNMTKPAVPVPRRGTTDSIATRVQNNHVGNNTSSIARTRQSDVPTHPQTYAMRNHQPGSSTNPTVTAQPWQQQQRKLRPSLLTRSHVRTWTPE